MIARRLRLSFLAAFAGTLAACGSIAIETTPPPDVTPPDAGAPDVGLPDVGLPDVGLPEAGLEDAGPPDTSPPVPPPDPGVRLSQGLPRCIKHASGTVTCLHRPGFDGPYPEPPWDLPGIDDAVVVTDALEHGCVLHATGRVSCWGYSHHSQLGLAIPTNQTSVDPIELPGVELVKLTTSHHAMCGIRPSGQAVCWGGGYYGPLGASTPHESQAEIEVIGVPDAIDISGAPARVCAVHATGKVACWVDHEVPAEIAGIEDAVQVSTDSLCALHATGEVVCWGFPSVAPLVVIPGLTDAVQVSKSCARRAAGGVVCWDKTGAPSKIAIEDAVDLSGSCAVKSDGSVVCWENGGEPVPFH
jgi:hypothetical protein